MCIASRVLVNSKQRWLRIEAFVSIEYKEIRTAQLEILSLQNERVLCRIVFNHVYGTLHIDYMETLAPSTKAVFLKVTVVLRIVNTFSKFKKKPIIKQANKQIFHMCHSSPLFLPAILHFITSLFFLLLLIILENEIKK